MLFRRVWYHAGLCSGGSNTPQVFVKRDIRPHRTLFYGVSDPAEQVYAIKCTQLCHCSAGSDTPQDFVLWGKLTGKIRPRRTRQKSFESLPFSLKGHFLKIICMYKLHYPRHIGSMLKEPPIWIFFVPRGLIPRRTTLKFEYLRELELEFEYVSGYELGAHMVSIHEKYQEPKISCYCTFKGRKAGISSWFCPSPLLVRDP
jgi:hypothetical protein